MKNLINIIKNIFTLKLDIKNYIGISLLTMILILFLNSISLNIKCFLLGLIYTLASYEFYDNNYKLSNIKLLKYLQISCIIMALLYFIYLIILILTEFFNLYSEWLKDFNLTPSEALNNKPSSSFAAWSSLEDNNNVVVFLINIRKYHLEIIGIYLIYMLGIIIIIKLLSKKLCTRLGKPSAVNIFHKNCFLNLGSLIFLFLIFYYCYKFVIIGPLGFVFSLISFGVSLLISSYVLDNFKYSKNVIIKYLQWIVIRFVCFIVFIVILFYIGILFDLIPSVECEGDDLAKNIVLTEAIKNYKLATPIVVKIPSLIEDKSGIWSVLESSETIDKYSPLQNLLLDCFILNVLILISVFILLYIIFISYIKKSNLQFISYIFDKFMPKKINDWFKIKIKKADYISDKFILIWFIIIFIILIFNIILNIIISAVLFSDIEDYIEVHNYLKNIDKSTLLLIGTSCRFNYKSKINMVSTSTTTSNTSSSFCAWSPLENNDNNVALLIDVIKDHLVLEIIGIYLLFMLGIIFICKLLRNNLELKFLSNIIIFKWPIGSYIKRFINWYINLWQKSSNIWIFFIIFNLIVFHCITTYSLFRILKFLNDI